MKAEFPRLYLWTFTTPDICDYKEFSRRFNRMMHDRNGMLDSFPDLSGLRVFEVHPGREVPTGNPEEPFIYASHGMHCHVVTDRRLPIDIVRVIAQRAGFGRIHVKDGNRFDKTKNAALYLGKYLSKQAKENTPAMLGIRRWQAFGGLKASKVKDIIVDSEFSQAYIFCASMIRGWKGLSFGDRMRFVTDFKGGMSFEECMESIGMYINDDPSNFSPATAEVAHQMRAHDKAKQALKQLRETNEAETSEFDAESVAFKKSAQDYMENMLNAPF